jgi:hypothetical protein
MLITEKAHQSGGPIPDALSLLDSPDIKVSPLRLQAFCLARQFAISAPMAEALAPLVYGEVWR